MMTKLLTATRRAAEPLADMMRLPRSGAEAKGDEAFALVDVPDVDVLVVAQVGGGVQQIFVNHAQAFRVQLAVSHSSAPDLG